jgi:MerR family mercuric resistance operon transcriptional regulator
VDQLRFIKRAQTMGFTLQEISSLLKLRAQDACHETRALAVSKLRLIDTSISELQQLRKELAQLVAACDANAGESHCPVIERLTH